jgi:hypothetical protein
VSGYHDDPERLTETLSAYLDGALPAAERDALERHLAGCAECQSKLAGLVRVGELLRALPEPALPRSFTLPTTTTRGARAVTSRRAPAWTRAAQWAGGLAAAVGLGLLVTGALPHGGAALSSAGADRPSTSQYGGETSAPATVTPDPDPDHSPLFSGGSPVATNNTNDTPQVVISPTTAPARDPTTTPNGVYGPTTHGERDQGGAAPLTPVGAALLIGGGAALTVGTVTRRRSRRVAAH